MANLEIDKPALIVEYNISTSRRYQNAHFNLFARKLVECCCAADRFPPCTHHVRPDFKHQGQRVAQSVERADDGGAPGLVHLSAPGDPPDVELRKEVKCLSEVLEQVPYHYLKAAK